MKKSQDHTHLTRLAAISLVVVMCLSALPMLAPSASAAAAEVPATPKGRGTVCITFDDVSSSVYDYAYPVMAEAGITGTVFVTTSNIGKDHVRSDQTRYMNVAELLDLQDNGWEIGSHSVNHTNYKTAGLTDDEIRYELSESKRILTDLGMDITTFAYPYGGHTTTSGSIGAEYYERMRTTEATGQFLSDYPPSHIETGVYYDTNIPTWNQCKALIDKAIETDTTVTLLFHWLDSDGNILGTQYDIQTLVDYLVEMRRTYGLSTVNYRDLPNSSPDAPIYVWDGEGGDDLASNKSNWRRVSTSGVVTNDVLPTAGSHLLWNATSNTACIYDLDIEAASWYFGRGYSSVFKIQDEFTARVGSGGCVSLQSSTRPWMTATTSATLICAGDVDAQISADKIDLIMTGNSARVYWGTNTLKSLTVASGAYITISVPAIVGVSTQQTYALTIEQGAVLHIASRDVCIIQTLSSTQVQIDGRIVGDGELGIEALHADQYVDLTNVTIGSLMITQSNLGSASAKTISVRGGPQTSVGSLTVTNKNVNLEFTVDVVDLLRVGSVTVGERATLNGGDATIYASSWDSTAGKWIAGNGTVVLADGGSAALAPAQSFNRLEIASDDGRTATWSMTATGAQAPIVTGLKSGSYLWYLDGVEQGEVKADSDGTIALSYQSTGLHSLEVKPTSMTEAMDGVYQAVGIVAVLAVLGGLITMVGRIKF